MWKSVLLFVVSCVVSVLGAEAIIANGFPQTLGVWGMTKDGITSHVPNISVYMEKFGQEISINSHGMRDREHTIDKPDGAYRILILGDSFMEALQVPFENSFPSLLERNLRDSGFTQVEVINASVSGWGTDDELTYLMRYGTLFRPDLVLIGMTLHNDVSDNLLEEFHVYSGGQLIQKPVSEIPLREYAILQIKEFLAGHSHLYQLVLKVSRRHDNTQVALDLNSHLATLINRSSDPLVAKGWLMTRRLLDKAKSVAAQSGAKLAVFLLPLAVQVSDQTLSEFLRSRNLSRDDITLDQPQQIMLQWGEASGVPVIDLLPAFGAWMRDLKSPLFLKDDGHWNREGHRLAAAIVSTRLAQANIVATSHHQTAR